MSRLRELKSNHSALPRLVPSYSGQRVDDCGYGDVGPELHVEAFGIEANLYTCFI